MRPSLSILEVGLCLIFLSRSFTRVYQQRAITTAGAAGARAADTPGSGVIPVWVSVLAAVGWATALVAAPWLLLR